MKITEDRLAVARAVWGYAVDYDHDRQPRDGDIQRIIIAIPEPPDDSPATLPAPAECHLCSRAMSDHPGGVYCPISEPEPLPAPTGPGWWWAHVKVSPELRGLYVEWEMVYVFREGDRRPESPVVGTFDGWVGPLIAPTAKGGA